MCRTDWDRVEMRSSKKEMVVWTRVVVTETEIHEWVYVTLWM